MLDLTVAEIKRKLQEADAAAFDVLERSLVADTRKGVRAAVEVARRRLAAEEAERARLAGMYDFERALLAERGGQVAVGLDEVGRGPVAGPLTVGAVVLAPDAIIEGLNDSKQVGPAAREAIAEEVKRRALAWSVCYVEASEIDAAGMTASLVAAFRRAVAEVEAAGTVPDVVLLDGNPLHMDAREVNVVKGDARCASIAAASIVAKVERDALMTRLDEQYPGYGFASNKGYASEEHIRAIKERGLSPVHRASFCTAFTQPTLF
ncbi:MAG: ribonuclease HII [Eggerthellaceae bacterium]|nr:ribonuclease HII [Eggerthellaceae bacterium]